jgi:hypothetical protein
LTLAATPIGLTLLLFWSLGIAFWAYPLPRSHLYLGGSSVVLWYTKFSFCPFITLFQGSGSFEQLFVAIWFC